MSDENLPAIKPIYYPVPMLDLAIDHLLRWATSGAEMPPGSKWQLINIPTSEDRNQLQARRGMLAKAALGNANRKALAEAITPMINCYRNALRPDEDMRLVVTKYVKELSDLPTWATEMACAKIRLGQTKFTTYCPSTIELRLLALTYLKPFRDEMINIDQVLMAEKYVAPISPEERKRVGEKVKAFAKEMHEMTGDGFSPEAMARQAKANLVRQIGADAFDAIQDAPPRHEEGGEGFRKLG